MFLLQAANQLWIVRLTAWTASFTLIGEPKKTGKNVCQKLSWKSKVNEPKSIASSTNLSVGGSCTWSAGGW